MVSSRREALKRGLVLLGAAVGVGAAGKAVAGGGGTDGAQPVARPAPTNTERITLHGQHWRVSSSELRPGQLPDRATASSATESSSTPREGQGGRLLRHVLRPRLSGAPGPDGLATLELHTLNLADGSITGTGTARASLDAADEFAIVGGTGRYVGARGSYVARQQPQEWGGDGTAEFDIRLVTEGGPNGH